MGPYVEVAQPIVDAGGDGLDAGGEGKMLVEEATETAGLDVEHGDGGGYLQHYVGNLLVGTLSLDGPRHRHPLVGSEDGGRVEDDGLVGVGHAHDLEQGGGDAGAVCRAAHLDDLGGGGHVRPDAGGGGAGVSLVDAQDDGHQDLLGVGDAVGADAGERLALAVEAHGVPAVRVDQDGRVLVDDGKEGHGGGADGQAHGGLRVVAGQVGQMGDPGHLWGEAARGIVLLHKVRDEGRVQGIGHSVRGLVEMQRWASVVLLDAGDGLVGG